MKDRGNIERKLIVSFTSWKKRIGRCAHTISLFLHQSTPVDRIVLNLSREEFPGGESSLPSDLISIVRSHPDVCEIYWTGENTNVWKKIIPTMERFPQDLIFSADDDIEYPEDYIEKMLDAYIKNEGRNPVTCYVYDRIPRHSGPFTLTRAGFYGSVLGDVYNNLIRPSIPYLKWQSDMVYTLCAAVNGVRYIQCKEIDGMRLYRSSQANKTDYYSDILSRDPFVRDRYKKNLHENILRLKDYICEKYHITDWDGLMRGEWTGVRVAFTTWKKRVKSVRVMCESLLRQSRTPDSIICYLSTEEFKGKMPREIARCLSDGLIDRVKWVDGPNTYAHKRWQVFSLQDADKYYNLLVDDDIVYPEDYIFSMVDGCRKDRNRHPICYYTRTIDYRDGRRMDASVYKGDVPDPRNRFFSGLCIFPPRIFPREILSEHELRDSLSPRCDDSWVNAWLLKKKCYVIGLHRWNGSCPDTIPGTQDDSTWRTYNDVVNENTGVQNIYTNLCNCLTGIKVDTSKIWPEMGVEKYKSI